eukprot:1156319-Pelagomonas_calceolata.AAC.7
MRRVEPIPNKSSHPRMRRQAPYRCRQYCKSMDVGVPAWKQQIKLCTSPHQGPLPSPQRRK